MSEWDITQELLVVKSLQALAADVFYIFTVIHFDCNFYKEPQRHNLMAIYVINDKST